MKRNRPFKKSIPQKLPRIREMGKHNATVFISRILEYRTSVSATVKRCPVLRLCGATVCIKIEAVNKHKD